MSRKRRWSAFSIINTYSTDLTACPANLKKFSPPYLYFVFMIKILNTYQGMSDIISLYFPHLIRVKAKRYKVSQYGSVQAECKKFNLNTQNTSFNALRIFLGRLFNIQGEFTVSFRNRKRDFLPLTSDWDLDVALSESSDSYLYIIIKPQSNEYVGSSPSSYPQPIPIRMNQSLLLSVLDEWDIIGPADIPQLEATTEASSRNRNSLMGSILDQMEKTMVKVTRALSMDSSPEGDCEKMPMVKTEFENFFDSNGVLIKPHEFHLTVFQGGVDPQLRPVVWMHLLNVFPEGLTSSERDSYLEAKCSEYYKLKKGWQKCVNEGVSTDLLKSAMNLIRKDVRRTDRSEKFYAGSDDNKNIQVLFNILTTYAAAHPKLSYNQGMSDLLSPLLYVMKDEAYAYICFCGMMKRLGSNFRCDGRSIKTKFRHLRKMLLYYDRQLFTYLRSEDASDLLFTYRWLLLELKREFAYTDALHMLEVLWGSLPPKPPDKELDLYDTKYLSTENPMTTDIIDTCSAANNLVWIDNYYGLTPVGGKTPQIHIRGKSAIEMQTLLRTENSTEEAEIKLPIHYRRRKYRPYIARKLVMLSDSLSSKDTGIVTSRTHDSNQFDVCQSWACGEDFESHPLKINAAVLNAREFLRTQWCYSNTVNELQLNNWLNGKRWSTVERRKDSTVSAPVRQRHISSSDSNYSTNSDELLCDPEYHRDRTQTKSSGRSEGYETDTTASLKDDSDEDYDIDGDMDEEEDDWFYGEYVDSMFGKKYEEAVSYFSRKKDFLPPPHVLGDGNPFLLFLCLSMIFQQREKILCRNMDLNELCLFFDKMVRKHKLGQVLSKARCMFGEYLNMGWNEDINDSEDDYDT